MTEEKILQLKEKLIKAGEVDICKVDKEMIPDIDEIKVGRKKLNHERIIDFIDSVDNPYLFKVDGILVKVEFSNNQKNAEECISNVLEKLYK